MRVFLSVIAAAAVIATTASAQDRPSVRALYAIGVEGGGLGFFEEETVLVSLATMRGATFWIAERWRREDNQLERVSDTKHQWIDGRACPGLADALDRLSDLPTMKFGTPEAFSETGLAFDVPMTSLSGPPAGPNQGLSITRREYVGPLATWRAKTSAAIAHCWRDEKVKIEGREAPTRLGDESAARAARP